MTLQASNMCLLAVCLAGAVMAGCESVEVYVPANLLPPQGPPLGFIPGIDTLESVQTQTRALGLQCKDASPKTAYAAAQGAQKKAATQWDAALGASAKWHKKTARTDQKVSPQVRWSCTKVPSSALKGVRGRPYFTGRWLFVFDDDTAPLRHVSYRRSHHDMALAQDDLRATVQAWRVRFERPQKVSTLPERGTPFPRMKPMLFEWQNSQRKATLSALSITGQRVDILEAIELPQSVSTAPPNRDIRPPKG